MTLEKLGRALVLFFVACGVLANSAMATPETKSGKTWFKNGTEIAAGADVSTSCHARPGTMVTFHGTIAGANVTITATGVQCLNAMLTNDSSPMAPTESDQLRFTGVTVEAPAGCTVPSTLTSKTLKGEIYGDSAVGSRFYERLAPAEEGTTLLTIPIEGCALEGSYPLKGVLYSRATLSTGVESESQEFVSDEETSKFGGLTLAGNAAFVTRSFIVQLVGTGTFQVH